jgi:hypothetical protein
LESALRESTERGKPIMQKEKAPNTAATVQGARKMEYIQGENTTKSPAGQGFVLAVTSLEAASLGLTMAESLCTLLAQGMGEETSGPMQPERVGMYSDSLWVLADHLRTAKEAVQQDTARLYQERRRVP